MKKQVLKKSENVLREKKKLALWPLTRNSEFLRWGYCCSLVSAVGALTDQTLVQIPGSPKDLLPNFLAVFQLKTHLTPTDFWQGQVFTRSKSLHWKPKSQHPSLKS